MNLKQKPIKFENREATEKEENWRNSRLRRVTGKERNKKRRKKRVGVPGSEGVAAVREDAKRVIKRESERERGVEEIRVG